MSARSKRASKPTTRREEDEDSDDVLYDPKKDTQPVKYVFRLLDNSDVSRSLVGAQVFVLWPDDGTWYRGRVKKCNPKEMTAFIYYEDTEEKETANLEELISEGQIAFKEERPLTHACGPNEIEQGQEYFGKQRDGGPAAEDSDEDQADGVADQEEDQKVEFEEDDDMHDAGAVEDEEDSDFQLSDEEEKKASSSRRKNEKESQSHRARKRGRGSGSPESQGSDEDEDDDDVPLGKRLTPTERAAQRRRHVMAKRAAAGMRNQIGGDDFENGEQEDEEDDAAVERLLAQASGAAVNSGSGGAQGRASVRKPQRLPAAAAAMKGGKKSGGGVGSTSTHDADIRAKVRSAFQQALDTALEEITAKDADADAKLPKPSVVASAVEDALVRLFGGTTKEYRSKMRTLHFNLKDSHNPDLRAAVLRGDIPPDTFVRMTATELASKELAEYRKRKEEEALKMSVLDAEAAAKFSTAAALDARDRLALPADVVGGKLLAARDGDSIPDKDGDADTQAGKSTTTKGSDHPSSATQDAQAVEGAENDAFTHQVGSPRASLGGVSGGGRGATALTKSDSGEASAPATARATMAAAAAAAKVDWASIKAQAVQAGPGDAGEELPTLNLPTTESMLGSHITLSSSKVGTEGNELGLSRDDNHAMGHGAFPPEHEAEKEDDRSRGGGVGGDAFDAQKQEHHHRQQQQQQQQQHFQNASEGLARILRPCPDRAVLSNAVWESELDVPGTGRFYVVADALAGSGDLAAMLGEAELVVKGRLAIDKVDHFLSELHLSKHRTVTLGIVRPAESATAAEREGLIGLAKQYQERGRTGVIEPGPGIEVYLIPPGHLSTRLLAAAAAVEPEAATDAARAGLDPGSFVAAAIHKLEMRAIPGAHRRIKRPRKHPQVVPLPAVPSAAGAAHALPPVPQLPDLSGLQALVAQTQAPTVHHQQLPSSTVPMVVPAQPSPSPQPPQPSAHVDLPAGLDLNAISALAAAFGVAAAAPQQPAPSPPAPSRPEPRQSRWEQPSTSIQQQLPPPSGSYQPPGFTLPGSTAAPPSSHPRPMSHMAEPAPGSTITRPMVNDHASGGYHPGGGGGGGAPPSARPMRYHAEGYGGGEDRNGGGHSRPARGGGGRHGSPMRPPYRRGGGGSFRGGGRRGRRGG